MVLNNLDQYGPKFQIKVISSLLTHKEFLINIHDILNPEDFPNIAHQWIIEEILKYYNKYHTVLDMEVLKIELQKIENEILRISVKEQLKEAYKSSEEELDYVKDEFKQFCSNQQIKKALSESIELLKVNDFEGIREKMNKSLRAGQDKNVGHEYVKQIEDRYREDSRITIPTPWNEINNLLQGGLGNGDFGLLFGNPGGGKSWMLVALGAFAVKMGYNVIHYTLELGEAYVGLRYDSLLTEIPVIEIKKHKKTVIDTISQLEGKVVIKDFANPSILAIEAHIQKNIEMSMKPDLIIIDYADLMRSLKKTSNRKEEIDDIYLCIKILAKRLDIPIWSVSQVNRLGARDNVVEGDRSAGSYDKTMIMDFGASLSRKRRDKVNGTGRLHIMKNRYGPDGMTFNMNVNTDIGNFTVLGEYNDEDDEGEENSPIPPPPKTFNNIETYDKKQLAKKFFELTHK